MRTLKETVNTYVGFPGFPYRSPEWIKREIKRMASRIDELREAVNVRGLLMDMVVECAKKEPERWAGEVKELSEEVFQSLIKLKSLEELLDGLLSEWREVKCAIRM